MASNTLPIAPNPSSGNRFLGLSGVQLREINTFFKAFLFLVPALVVFAAFTFIPLGQLISLSTYLTNPIGKATVFVGLEQYQDLFGKPAFLNSMTRSFQFVLYMVPTTLILALILATLGNLQLKGIAIFRIAFSVTIAVSGATASLMFMYLYHPNIGTLNYILSLFKIEPIPWLTSEATAIFAVALPAIWLQLGLNTVILLAAMQGVSEELYESAMIDGAGWWNCYFSITLPLLGSTFFFLFVVDTLAAFQTFTPIQVLTNGGPVDSTNLLVYSIYREFYFNGKYGVAAAQSIMLFIIMLILTILQFVFVERKVFYE